MANCGGEAQRKGRRMNLLGHESNPTGLRSLGYGERLLRRSQ